MTTKTADSVPCSPQEEGGRVIVEGGKSCDLAPSYTPLGVVPKQSGSTRWPSSEGSGVTFSSTSDRTERSEESNLDQIVPPVSKRRRFQRRNSKCASMFMMSAKVVTKELDTSNSSRQHAHSFQLGAVNIDPEKRTEQIEHHISKDFNASILTAMLQEPRLSEVQNTAKHVDYQVERPRKRRGSMSQRRGSFSAAA